MTKTVQLADDVIRLYQDHGEAFLKSRNQALIEQKWLDVFLDVMPKGKRKVLDIGCGSGKPIAEYLIKKNCQITGVDSSPYFIELATHSFSDHHWLVKDMRHLENIGQFHGLIAWHSSFHLKPQDQRPMFETFRTITHKNAVLMFTSGTHLGEAIGIFEGNALYHGSLDTAEYRQLLNDNGFIVLQYTEDDKTCGGANIWLAQKVD
ncbi:class I SAM-dependent methyltransferase [Brucellaceae bacterium C25G]